ncbi:hypothetical protein TorRG33x02_145810 [Trema orientale]|uniref:Uncharacterized protein n=1 Tax=Trema orientale TaxID=63057 RepID=A0A2P5EVP1_TREOI|nr:hypothetical protein TorRG33x02_145810 [Trema orientale]
MNDWHEYSVHLYDLKLKGVQFRMGLMMDCVRRVRGGRGSVATGMMRSNRYKVGWVRRIPTGMGLMGSSDHGVRMTGSVKRGLVSTGVGYSQG